MKEEIRNKITEEFKLYVSEHFHTDYIPETADQIQAKIDVLEKELFTDELYQRCRTKKAPAEFALCSEQQKTLIAQRMRGELRNIDSQYASLCEDLKKRQEFTEKAGWNAGKIFMDKTEYEFAKNDLNDQLVKQANEKLILYLESGDFIDDEDTLNELSGNFHYSHNQWMAEYGEYTLTKAADAGYPGIATTEQAITGFLENPGWIYDAAEIHGAIHGEEYERKFSRIAQAEFEEIFGADMPKDGMWDSMPLEDDIFDILREGAESLSREKILRALRQNPKAGPLLRQMDQEKQILKQADTFIPENYADLFKEARNMKRNIIVHCGPTNSGKTHESLERLKQADCGIYLGPLRLLAYEAWQTLKEQGVSVSLITGEEEIIMENASVTCSTCEMADLTRQYDAAVIDEAQMLEDPERGGAWTNAILGLQAAEIHICCSPEALNIISSLVQSCGDSLSVIHHERMTPLEYTAYDGPEKGDALIVFSRRKVHGLASQLRRQGFRVSIVYGALPYSVRENEARKFREGKTDILVATDAIGMGMNLPIRRVVFMEHRKFDGTRERPLTAGEVQQIAGRAGRFGIYNTGYFASSGGHEQFEISAAVPDIKKVLIGFPDPLRSYNVRVSAILKKWDEMEISAPFVKQSAAHLIQRAEFAENLSDSKSKIWDLISISFDEDREEELELWKSNAVRVLKNWKPDIGSVQYDEEDSLYELEQEFRQLDILYQFCRKFGTKKQRESILRKKEDISRIMMEKLDAQSYEEKRCSSCGKKLSWDSPYGMCSSCYSEMQQERMAYRRARSGWYDEIYEDLDDFDDWDEDDDF